MIHRHLVRNAHVEFVEYQGLGEVPGEFWMSLDRRYGPRTEALVGNRKPLRHADEKGGNQG
jgi:hypothetical protein